MTIDRHDFNTLNLSREIAEAARDLANRIELGEFDDLDEAALTDLRGLSQMMTYWATLAQALEQHRSAAAAASARQAALRPNAQPN